MTTRIYLITLMTILTLSLFGQSVIQKSVHFDNNSSLLKFSDKQMLDSLITELKPFTSYLINLSGHTDNVGSDKYNIKLSQDRTISVKNYLTAKSIDSLKINFQYFGESKPKIENISDNNKATNRRVEITINVDNIGQKMEKPCGQLPNMEDSTKADKKEEAIILSYGTNVIGDIEISIISNTKEMEANNLTTMTVNNEPLISNLMFCVRRKNDENKKNCLLEKPIKVLIPINLVSACDLVGVEFFDAEKDSLTNLSKWKVSTEQIESIKNGTGKYFVATIKKVCEPCKNYDCREKNYIEKGSIKLKSKKRKLTEIKIVHEKANYLLLGQELSKNKWSFDYYKIPKLEMPTIKVKAVDKKKRNYSLEINLSMLKRDKQGNYIISKDMLKRN